MNTPEQLVELSRRLCTAATEGNLNQSLLFVAQEGVGQFALIMKLAETLLCENDRTACGACFSCREVARLYHPDFLLLFPFPNLRPESKKVTVFHFSDPTTSAAKFSEDTKEAVEQYRQSILVDPYALADFEKKENIPVEVVKDLIASLAKKPMRGARRVVAVLDIDKMAYGAADLFLKTVEEPPQNTHLFLTTSKPNLLYPTLLSRTQRIKVPPVPEEAMQKILKEQIECDSATRLYLSRISGGSPGRATRLFAGDIISRRENILKLVEKLLTKAGMGALIADIDEQYGGYRNKYDDVKIDFDIIETIIHDLYILKENDLDNHLVNVDIKGQLADMEIPAREVLDIWNGCLTETRRACTVNNVAADTGMMFFYVSCAEAMESQTRPKFTLP